MPIDIITDESKATTLLDHHRRELHASGLTDATINAAGIYSETNTAKLAAKVRQKFWSKKRGPAIVFPYFGLDGKPIGVEKVKPDNPRRRGGDGKPIKYEWPKGAESRVYFPPGIAAMLADGCDLIVTEGEKKALCGTQNGYATIGVQGVWNIYGRGSCDLPYDMSGLDWNRRVYVAYDSDWATNENVRKAGVRLAGMLKRRGAFVKLVSIPDADDGEKVGLDDFIVAHGATAFRRLLDEATDPEDEPPEIAREPAKNVDPVPEARRMLAAHGRDAHGNLSLRYHRGSYWNHTGKRYVERSEREIRAAIVKWLDPKFFDVTTSVVGNVLQGIAAETIVSDSRPLPTWLGKDSPSNPVAVENGILSIDDALAGRDALRPHTAEWFSPVCLPYRYDPTATCPKWLAAIDRNLSGDAERIALLQEYFGYCLTASTDQQKFLMLYGEGGTGKSTALAGLVGMLGTDNIASVPLERFGERFALFQTLGKLANVAAEIGEVDKVAEGYLKALTSGDPFEYERKHKDPITAAPTARLIFSTNNLPRFADRSGGLWRRMILMPFDAVIPETERVRGMDKPRWWQDQGELPGILNWSLAGLRRLREQERFTRSAVVEAAVAEYREESNPAATFLRDGYREHVNGTVSKRDLFAAYREWCEDTGHRAMNDVNFSKEVRRTFPTAVVERPRIGGSRGRVWAGICRGGDGGPDEWDDDTEAF